MFGKKNFLGFFIPNIPYFWVQEFLPIERGGVFFISFACFVLWCVSPVRVARVGGLLSPNHYATYGEPRVSSSKKPVSILSGKTNLATNIPAGALPTPMKAKRSNGLESQLSILTVLSPLKSKKHLCEKCFLALDNRLSTIVCIKL